MLGDRVKMKTARVRSKVQSIKSTGGYSGQMQLGTRIRNRINR